MSTTKASTPAAAMVAIAYYIADQIARSHSSTSVSSLVDWYLHQLRYTSTVTNPVAQLMTREMVQDITDSYGSSMGRQLMRFELGSMVGRIQKGGLSMIPEYAPYARDEVNIPVAPKGWASVDTSVEVLNPEELVEGFDVDEIPF